MAEIKSAIELAMERTKDLRLSHEELEKIKEGELQTKVQSLVNRYLEVDFHLREVEKELAKADPQQRLHLEKLFLQALSEAIHLDRDNDLIFQAIETFRGENKNSLQKVKDLIHRYQERKAKEYQKTEAEILRKLEHTGIRGSAVQAKVEGSPEWEENLAKFKPAFEKDLRSLKKEFKI